MKKGRSMTLAYYTVKNDYGLFLCAARTHLAYWGSKDDVNVSITVNKILAESWAQKFNGKVEIRGLRL